MKTLYMLVGFPGAGKDTWLSKRPNLDNATILSTDKYIEYQARINCKTYNEMFHDCIKDADKMLEQDLIYAIKHNQDIYWNQTNLSKKARRHKLNKVPFDYHKIAVVFSAPSDILDKVNEERKAFGRSLPQHVLDSMKKSFQFPTLSEGFDVVMGVTRE